MMEYLYDKLKQYEHSGYYGFHMPGHKRSHLLTGAELPYGIDITEIDGFDDLHHAEGILKEAQERAARIYGAEETHYLVNGSTAGLLSAVLGCTRRGDSILMARNCHKSVYNAVFLNELRPIYLYPRQIPGTEINGEISVKQTEKLLEKYPRIKAVVITSPTYDGVVSDVKSIAEIAHKRGIPLIVDEAHGAHFGFHPYFPPNSNALGADIVIHSLHKTLPSLTQTGLLHMNGSIVERSRIRRCLHMLQSSSPSYVLMASIDECVRMLAERGTEIFAEYTARLDHTRKRLEHMKHMRLLKAKRYDLSKLVISGKNLEITGKREKLTGRVLCCLMREKYLLQAEMAVGSYAVFMTSPADTREGLDRLVSALWEIDQMLAESPGDAELISADCQEQVLTVSEAEDAGRAGWEVTDWENAAGRIALEYAYLYPPGIPLIVPGERIGKRTAQRLQLYEDMDFTIEGTEKKGKIKVLQHG